MTSTLPERIDAVPATLPSASHRLGCVVLCGGLGTRLAGVLPDLPKALADVSNRPFIEWVLLGLRRQGITDVVLATGHRGDQVEERLADGGHLGMRLRYSREATPLGTAGALRHALTELKADAVLVVNGDTYCEVPVRRLAEAHRHHGGTVTMLTTRVADRARYGAVELGAGGRVLSFDEKTARGPGLVSSGAYIVNRGAVERLPGACPVDIESGLLPQLGEGEVFAVVSDGPFVDIGTPESLAGAAEVVRAREQGGRLRTRGNAVGHVQAHFDATARAMRQTAERCASAVAAAAEMVAGAFTSGNKLLLCGNGGSAADCQHIAAEFVSRLERDFDRAALPAIALTTDSSFLTAYANDVDFDGVFARQVEALGQPGDVLLAISTSGASRNVARAIEAAHRRHVRVVGLFGEGAPLAEAVDVAVVIPSRSTQATQECMLAVEHSICEVVEQMLYGTGAGSAEQAAS